MRYRSLAVAVCVSAAGLVAAGCSAGGAGSSSGSSAAASATASTAPSGAAAAQEYGSCQPDDLGITFGASTGAAGQQMTLAMDLTNKGALPCTMDGFPGVNLVGSARGQANYTWPLARAAQSYSVVTVAPGTSVHFDIVYLPGNPSGANGSAVITVHQMVITPPNDFTHAEVNWDQSVLLQDGATHPGTYITPVAFGA